MENELPVKKTYRKRWILLGVLGVVIITGLLVNIFWFKPAIVTPISEPIVLPTRVQIMADGLSETPDNPSNLPEAPIFTLPTPKPQMKPVCGEDAQWLVLLVGIDYRGEGYLYGLADVIRIARIDFVNMTVNMVALPRDLIVEAPEGRFDIPDPYKLNQAYLFGTPGMRHYTGTGDGASALAEIIRYNFGITIDHYGVVNFETFIKFIDSIGGVEIDLPMAVSDEDFGGFPAGKQTLNGTRALALARVRRDYGDDYRVNNQTLILRSVLNKLINPAVLVRLPDLLEEFTGGFLTDLSIEQLGRTGICFLRNFDGDNLHTFQVPKELLSSGSSFIPTLNDKAFVYTWDQRLVDWVYQSLMGE